MSDELRALMSLFWSQELQQSAQGSVSQASEGVYCATDVQVTGGEKLAAVKVWILSRSCLEDVAR